jgi:hypothetical protein
MHTMKRKIACEICGAGAEQEVVPDGFDEVPTGYTLTRTCSERCDKAYGHITPEQATELTGHSWNGATGQWTRLVSASTEGWVP